MSFNIFASGSEDFHFRRNQCIDSNSFDAIKVVDKLKSISGAGSKEGAASFVTEEIQPSGITDAIEKLATMEFLHNLNNAVSFLAMCSDASSGWIFISSCKSRFYWTDLKSNAKYDFSPGESPGAEFVKRISPALKETEMNNWGVLLQLSNVLAKYSNHIGQTGRPMINISLDK